MPKATLVHVVVKVFSEGESTASKMKVAELRKLIKKKWSEAGDKLETRIAFVEAIENVPVKPKAKRKRRQTNARGEVDDEKAVKRRKISKAANKYQILGGELTWEIVKDLITNVNGIDKKTLGGEPTFEAGNLVTAYYAADYCWYGGKLLKKEGDVHTVLFFDGEEKIYENAKEIDSCFKVGDIVRAKWSDSQWYSGVILSVTGTSYDDMSYVVMYDKAKGEAKQKVKAFPGEYLQMPHVEEEE